MMTFLSYCLLSLAIFFVFTFAVILGVLRTAGKDNFLLLISSFKGNLLKFFAVFSAFLLFGLFLNDYGRAFFLLLESALGIAVLLAFFKGFFLYRREYHWVFGIGKDVSLVDDYGEVEFEQIDQRKREKLLALLKQVFERGGVDLISVVKEYSAYPFGEEWKVKLIREEFDYDEDKTVHHVVEDKEITRKVREILEGRR